MKIHKTSTLNDFEIKEIQALEEIALAPEKLQNKVWLSSQMNFTPDLPCFFLLYENNELISFLSLFMPTKEEAEVIAFTHPEQRRKGYFKTLLAEAEEVIREANIPSFLFNVETKSRSGNECLKSFQSAVFSHSEYRMEYVPLASDIIERKERISVTQITDKKSQETSFYADIAKEEWDGDEDQILSIVDSATRRGYLLSDNNKPVGVFNIESSDGLLLCGLVVSKELRNKGYGRMIIKEAKRIAGNNPLYLEVDNSNPAALHLYESEGFKITFQVDYYSLII